MRRGPYKEYLNPDLPDQPLSAAVKRRRGITDRDLNLTQEEEFRLWSSNSSTSNILTTTNENTGTPAVVAEEDDPSFNNIDEGSVPPVQNDVNQQFNSNAYESENESSSDSDASVRGEEDHENSDNESESIGDNEDNYFNNDSFKSLNDFLKNHLNALNINNNVNPADVLIMVLTLCIAHNFTLTAVVDVLCVINFVCGCNIFPTTKHLFKKLFNPQLGFDMHFTCESCGHYLGKKGEITSIYCCTNCQFENNLNGYKYDYCFITLDIRAQLKDILQNNKCKINTEKPQHGTSYSGLKNGSIYQNAVPNENDEEYKYLTVNFNIDGSPISHSSTSKTSVTPMYLMINELDLKSRRKHMILAGLWYGQKKPRIDVFLKPLTENLNSLREEGIKIKIGDVIKKFKVITLCGCVDSVARPAVQGMVGIGGYFCCSWCEIEGKPIDGPVKYLFQYPFATQRTEASFRDCYINYANGSNDCKGINSVTPLINLSSFNMVWGFTPDYLHCVLLGVVKRFINLWVQHPNNMDGSQRRYYIGKPNEIESMNDMLNNIEIPSNLKRSPPLIKKIITWKGRELENWLLYFSFPIIKTILHEKYVKHWKLLISSMSILLQDEVTENDICIAEKKLIEFVYYIDELYGEYELTYNVHQLLHLAESCRKFGPLWTHTTFPFESMLRRTKRVVNSTRGIPHQIVRNIEMNRALDYIIERNGCSDEVSHLCESIESFKLSSCSLTNSNETLLNLKGSITVPPNILNIPDNVELLEYAKFVKSGISFSKQKEKNTKINDSYVQIKNGQFSQIKHIVMRNDTKECYVVLQNIISEPVAGLIFMKKISRLGNICAVSINNIKCQAVKIVGDGCEYISSIPNNHYLLNL